jgi:hypothetical protein
LVSEEAQNAIFELPSFVRQQVMGQIINSFKDWLGILRQLYTHTIQ